MACGSNSHGQLGNGSKSNCPSFSTVIAEDVKFAQVACGQNHTLFLDVEGIVYACGSNDSGQLGINGISSLAIPAAIATATVRGKLVDDFKAISISCGLEHSAAVSIEGDPMAWGNNSSVFLIFRLLIHHRDVAVWVSGLNRHPFRFLAPIAPWSVFAVGHTTLYSRTGRQLCLAAVWLDLISFPRLIIPSRVFSP